MLSEGISSSLDLILNLTLLVALSILSGFIEKRFLRTTIVGALMQGALFGVTAVLGMLRPLVLGPGLIFDGRSVMVSLCALFFGPWSAAVASAMTIAYRAFLGGSGTLMGVLVILSSASIGLAARRLFRPGDRPPNAYRLYAFGLIVHLAMLALMFTLPDNAGPSVIGRVGLPVIVLYPLATILAGKILSDQVEAERSVAALHQSEERFKLSMEATNDGLWDLNVSSDEAYYNPAYYRILGYEPGEFPTSGYSWRERIHPDDAEAALSANQRCIDGQVDLFRVEFRLLAKDGQWRWILARGKCIERDGNGRALRLVGTHIDITERKLVEERLKKSLDEKDVLLREVHHRVKNNLNIISSLLNLQASIIQTPEQAIEAFGNSRDRIMAMALVHEELYKSRDYASVDMDEYLQRLAKQLLLAYGSNRPLELSTQANGVHISVSASIPCGLILNELITNAFKYAFEGRDRGSIRVVVEYAGDDDLQLSVIDDGIGIPDGYDKPGQASFGLTLIRLLVDQLDGAMDISVSNGTACRVRFPRR